MIAKPAAMPPIWGAKNDSTPATSVHDEQRPQAVEDRARRLQVGQRVLVLAPASSRAIGVVALVARAEHVPISVAMTHQRAQT